MIFAFGRRAALAVAAAIIFAIGLRAQAAEEPFGRLKVDEVAAKIGKPGVFIYDSNSAEDYAKGHVPTAKWVDYDHVQASDLPKDKAATLIFYCANEH